MRRWIVLAGRSGTFLLAVGLAFLLLSSVPPVRVRDFGGDIGVFAERFETLRLDLFLTPQQGLSLDVSANGTLNVYLLEVSDQTLMDWMNEDLEPKTADLYDTANLEAFLDAKPETVAWQSSIDNGKAEHEYFSTSSTNASVIVSNPSSEFVRTSYEGFVNGYIAPVNRVRTVVVWIIPAGLVLAAPWFASLLRTRTQKRIMILNKAKHHPCPWCLVQFLSCALCV